MSDQTLVLYMAEAVIVGLLGYLLKITNDVREVLRAINGRVGRMEEWRMAHDKQDDERHMTALRHIDRLDGSSSAQKGQ